MSTDNLKLSSETSEGNNASVTLDDPASIIVTRGEKLAALRKAKKISQRKLAEMIGMTERAIRYVENGQRQPGIDMIQKVCEVLDVHTSYFMDDTEFERESQKEAFLKEAYENFGSRGKAQAKRLLQDTQALFASGELHPDDRQAFIEEMQDLFLECKQEARELYTPKKYRKD